MRNLKKFLALILAFMMTFSLMVTVNAADTSKDFTDGVTEKFVEGVKVLNGMKVFRGYEDGSFNPKGEITRAEVAAIVYRLATGDYNDTQSHLYKDYVNFDDVHSTDWFAGYVNYCANAQWIEGYGNGKFGPNDKVTGYQAAAMILRAVGYGKNNEFKGASWQVQVANVTRSEGLLVNVDNTNYANTLNQPATRELIAEILFQAAQIPTVTWTMLNGYNKYTTPLGVNGELNPSLGEKNYGLTSDTGIIVGNEATGEDYTKVSMEVYAVRNDTATKVIGYEISDVSYKYDSGTTPDAVGNNVTLEYNIETGLDLFGHKATVWYNNKTAQGSAPLTGDGAGAVYSYVGSQFATTYAVIDEATLFKTVWANNLTTNDKVAGKTSVYSAAVAAGFHKNSAPAYESDVFSRIAAQATANTAIQSKVGMYTIISNSANKAADVVIPLNLEVAKITQVNTTVVDGEYIYLGEGASKFGDDLTSGVKGKILMDNLAPGADTKLGDVVTAFQIIGTTDEKGNIAAADYLYDTRKLASTVTGAVATYKIGTDDVDGTNLGKGEGTAENIVTKVTLTDGKSYDLSGITGSQYGHGFDNTQDSHLIDKAVAPLTTKNIAAGVTYTFYLDDMGSFIGVSAPNTNGFLYGTFADYSMGALGTAEMDYFISGFGWDGSAIKNHALISYNGTALKGHINTTYNALTVSRKDLGQAGQGNEIKVGYNTGYMIDEDGNLTTTGINGTKFISSNNGSPMDGTNTHSWVISSQDATNGFARVKNYNDATGTDYLLTNDTKFIVVSGIGINATVKVYNGLKDLVGTGSSAEIVGDGWNGGTVVKNDEVWFQTSEDVYGNVDTSKNNTIQTVIMSDDNLVQYGAQSLFFVAPQETNTGVQLAGNTSNDTINQYEMYVNGVKGYYWVNDTVSGVSNVPAGGDDGNFYTLIQIDTISGQPIYKATQVSDNNTNNHIKATYKYVVVNNVNTAEILCDTAAHNPNNDKLTGKVYKVDKAVVAEAYGKNDVSGLFPDGTNIKDVLTLNHAVSMGEAGAAGNLYTVQVAIVYSGIDVSCIYVTNITNTP